MYRYYRSHTTGEYVVVFDNPRCGVVEDRRYETADEAAGRVYEMNETFEGNLEPDFLIPQNDGALYDMLGDLMN